MSIRFTFVYLELRFTLCFYVFENKNEKVGLQEKTTIQPVRHSEVST